MKSEHRHELKTNELAEWLINFPQWAKENIRMIIYVSVVAVLVVVVAYWKWYSKNVESVRKQINLTNAIAQLPKGKKQIIQVQQTQEGDISYMLLRPANTLELLAQQAKDGQMAALALIKRAEALRTELHYRLGTVNKQDMIAQTNLAKTSYAEAVEKATTNPSLMAKARLGLGLCEEELGNFEEAEQIYSNIITDASLEGTTAVAAAKQRLDTMADYQQKIAFKPPPKPTPAESIPPQVQLTTPDTNMPQVKPKAIDGNLPQVKPKTVDSNSANQ